MLDTPSIIIIHIERNLIRGAEMIIKIKRDSGFVDKIRAYKIVLDGDVVGKIMEGEHIEIDVAPGNHQVYLKIDWCKSNTVEFEVSETMLDFECGSSLRGERFWLPFIELIYITFKRNQYLWLRKV